MKIRILSYNIHKGHNWHNGKVTLLEIREAIRSTDADLVFLQEVIGERQEPQSRAGGVWRDKPQFEYLADSIWTHYAYAKNAIYDHGHHGNVILSKYPLATWEQQDISTNNFEQRGILYGMINLENGKTMHCYCLHLNLTQGGREKQYRSICERIQKDVADGDIVIVAGDFNDWSKKSCCVFEEEMGLVEAFKFKQGNYPKTFPALFPLLSLDRVYVKNLNILEAKTCVGSDWRHISDHVPILIDVEIPG